VGAAGYAQILTLRNALLLAALCLPGAAHAAGCGSLDLLGWLAGDWVADGEKTVFHESWTRVAPATLEGVGVERSKSDGKPRMSESLRLVQMEGAVYYLAKVPHNELPVAFRLIECGDGRYVFENPAHDFPRRIEYARDEEGGLTVRLGEGSDQGFTLAFRRPPDVPVPAAAVLAAEDARFAAMIGGLPAEVQRWLAADLEYVHLTGEVATRDALIESIASGAIRYLAFEPGERRVTFLDQAAAVVQGPARLRLSAGASPLEVDMRYLAVYVLVDGTWQLHAWQSLRLTSPTSEGQ
jgi:hypothetical protein